MKVVTVLGTRPEIIRLSRVLHRLHESVDHTVIHTGQNYDFELNEVFFSDLGVRRPDVFLEVDTSSLGSVLGGVLQRSEKPFRELRPDALLVLGDTNSALVAVMAKRLGIPVFHMEAGNRSFDPNVPEEVNRKIVDHIADVNLVYTEHARRNLLSEGIPAQRIYLTGSPLREVLDCYREQISAARPLAALGIEAGNYYLASIHREENVDRPERLSSLIGAFDELAIRTGLPVIVSTHPRTRNRLEALGGDAAATGDIRFLAPFGFHDYNHLQLHARCVLSDSGSIAEEAAILGFPAVTMRNSIERPEALDTGSVIVTGIEPANVVAGVQLAESLWAGADRPAAPADYTITDTSVRVVKAIVGMAPLVHGWTGRRPQV